MIAVVVTDGVTAPAAPAGWTLIESGNAPGSAATMYSWWKIAGASEPTSYIFSWGSPIEDSVGAILRYSGANATSPIDVSDQATGASTSATAPDVTTTVANTKVLRVYGSDECVGVSAVPLHDARYYDCSCGNAGRQCMGRGADVDQTAAGSTGTAVLTISPGEQWIAFTIAIAPV